MLAFGRLLVLKLHCVRRVTAELSCIDEALALTALTGITLVRAAIFGDEVAATLKVYSMATRLHAVAFMDLDRVLTPAAEFLSASLALGQLRRREVGVIATVHFDTLATAEA